MPEIDKQEQKPWSDETDAAKLRATCDFLDSVCDELRGEIRALRTTEVALRERIRMIGNAISDAFLSAVGGKTDQRT